MICVRPHAGNETNHTYVRTSIRYGQQNERKNRGQCLENPISGILVMILMGRRCSGCNQFVQRSHQVTQMNLNEEEDVNGASVDRTRYAFSRTATHAQQTTKAR